VEKDEGIRQKVLRKGTDRRNRDRKVQTEGNRQKVTDRRYRQKVTDRRYRQKGRQKGGLPLGLIKGKYFSVLINCDYAVLLPPLGKVITPLKRYHPY